MKKRFRRKKNIKWIMPFGKIYLKPKKYRLATVTIKEQRDDR